MCVFLNVNMVNLSQIDFSTAYLLVDFAHICMYNVDLQRILKGVKYIVKIHLRKWPFYCGLWGTLVSSDGWGIDGGRRSRPICLGMPVSPVASEKGNYRNLFLNPQHRLPYHVDEVLFPDSIDGTVI